MILGEDEILPVMEEEFPFIYLSPHTAKLMWQKQMRQVDTLSKIGRPHKSIKTQRRLEEAQRKQEALTQIMKKELEHNKRLVTNVFLIHNNCKGSLQVDSILTLFVLLILHAKFVVEEFIFTLLHPFRKVKLGKIALFGLICKK